MLGEEEDKIVYTCMPNGPLSFSLLGRISRVHYLVEIEKSLREI